MNFFLGVRINGYCQIMKVEKERVMEILDKNRGRNLEIVVFIQKSFNVVIKVHGEYAPFQKVEYIEGLYY